MSGLALPRPGQPGRPPPEPAWTVDGAAPGRLVTGVQLRVGTAAVTVLGAAVSVAGDAGARLAPLSVLAGLLVVAGVALAPTTPAPTLGLLLVVAVVVDRSPPLGLVVVLAAALHAVHLGASWCAAVPRSARLPVAALAPSVRRWALAQALALPVAAGVALSTRTGISTGADSPGRSGGPDGDAWRLAATLLAGVVLLLLALLVVHAVHRGGQARRGREPSRPVPGAGPVGPHV